MKIIKKLTTISIITVLLFSLCAFQVVFAATEVPAVTKNVNLAKNKVVDSSVSHTDAAKLTDGQYDGAVSGTAVAGETFTIDLERYATITEIKLWPVADSETVGADISNIALEISNDGVDFTTLASQGDRSSETLTSSDAFVAAADEGTVCRYVRVRKTEAGSYSFSELQVFANVQAVEVSREADCTVTETSNSHTALLGPNVVDGFMWSAWRLVDTSHTSPVNLVIDLGKEYPLTLLEMHQATDFTHPDFTAFDIYCASEAEGQPSTEGTPTSTLLLSTNGLSGASELFSIERDSYRYVVLSKAARKALALAEFQAYIIKPEYAYSELLGQTLKIHFSDKMDSSTYSNIVVKVDNEIKTITPEVVDDYTVKFELDAMYYGSTITADIPETVTDIYGTAIVPNIATHFAPAAVEMHDFKFLNGKLETSTEITGLSGNLSAAASVTFTNNQPEKTETVILLSVLYDANNTMIRADEKRATLLPGSDPTQLKAGFTLPADTTGCKMAVFIWKDYDLMKPWTFHSTLTD